MHVQDALCCRGVTVRKGDTALLLILWSDAHLGETSLPAPSRSVSSAATETALWPRCEGCCSLSSERSLSVLLWLWHRGAQTSSGAAPPRSARRTGPAPAASVPRTRSSLRSLISSRGGRLLLTSDGATTVTV